MTISLTSTSVSRREAVRIRQSGFAARIPFADFLGRYKIVVPKVPVGNKSVVQREVVLIMARFLGFEQQKVFGLSFFGSKTFWSKLSFSNLESKYLSSF